MGGILYNPGLCLGCLGKALNNLAEAYALLRDLLLAKECKVGTLIVLVIPW